MHDDAGLDAEVIARVAEILVAAKSALFITGAGLSADSGLPTYRGVGGLYNDATTDDGVPIELALSGEMFAARPELTWKHIYQIESACRGAHANRGHEVIAALEKELSRVWVLTQNVDGFHGDAGSRNLIEIHGNIHDLRCTACPWRTAVPDYAELDIPPRCPDCGALVRPDVVLFGEMLPPGPLGVLREQLDRGFDVVFSVGTTSVFPYIVQPVLAAAAAGTPTVEINPGTTEISGLVQHRIQARAGDAFAAIWTAYRARAG